MKPWNVWTLNAKGVVVLDSEHTEHSKAVAALLALHARRVAAVLYGEANLPAQATGHTTAAAYAAIERVVTGTGVLATRKTARSMTAASAAPRCPTKGCTEPMAPSHQRLDPRLRSLCKRCRGRVWMIRAKGCEVTEAIERLSWPKPWMGLELKGARDARRRAA